MAPFEGRFRRLSEVYFVNKIGVGFDPQKYHLKVPLLSPKKYHSRVNF